VTAGTTGNIIASLDGCYEAVGKCAVLSPQTDELLHARTYDKRVPSRPSWHWAAHIIRVEGGQLTGTAITSQLIHLGACLRASFEARLPTPI
jgi:hypothetical protein